MAGKVMVGKKKAVGDPGVPRKKGPIRNGNIKRDTKITLPPSAKKVKK